MSQSIAERIADDVKSNKVLLYMKGNPEMPQCGFSANVSQILQFLNVDFAHRDVLADLELRDGIKVFTNWPTLPQLYVNGDFLGGCDIVREMFESGELKQSLQAAGAITE